MMKRAAKMDYGAMLKTANMLHKKTGKSRIWLLADMAKCAARYNAGYIDYKIAEMYRLNDAQRATQITRGISNSIVARMNDKKFWHFFDNKTEFNQLFSAQVKRGWLNLLEASEEDFAKFLEGRGDIICKPIDGSSGQGILKCTPEEYGDPKALYQRLREAGIGIVEDKVIQHPAIAALCPTSVNTIRVATLLGDKKEGIVYAYIRIGNGKVMDNVDCGGMAAPVDIETGVITGVGANKAGETYEIHPMTGTKIPGTQIPYWEDVKTMCLNAMHVVPQVRFVAWDVAITEDGPVFIEGNSFPSHAIPQFAAHFPNGIGILPRFEEFIDL
ncbi:MAG: sugar-transfer associated ATP-grasp domain-containing protein [Candidatus Ventricola sp.]|nr:sugar-transfer associated ATP-grasp domain-containing protein [Candidatus Ventricola sp.]